MLIVLMLVTCSLTEAVDLSRSYAYTCNRCRIMLEYVNKDYFKDFTFKFLYNRSSSYTLVEFTNKKPLTDDFYFEINFYHLRNNQYSHVPISRAFTLGEFLKENYFQFGATLKEALGGPSPYPPKKYTMIINNRGANKNIFPVPMLGEYKITITQLDEKIKTLQLAWVGSVNAVVKKN